MGRPHECSRVFVVALLLIIVAGCSTSGRQALKPNVCPSEEQQTEFEGEIPFYRLTRRVTDVFEVREGTRAFVQLSQKLGDYNGVLPLPKGTDGEFQVVPEGVAPTEFNQLNGHPVDKTFVLPGDLTPVVLDLDPGRYQAWSYSQQQIRIFSCPM